MLRSGEKMKIKEMYETGITISDIAKQTGRDRKTVRKMINNPTIPKYKRDHRVSVLDPYKTYILQRLAKGVLNATKIYEEIKKMGYQGKTSILRAFINPLRPIAESRFTERFETGPGEQAQCDWGSFGSITDGITRRKLYCFVMVLSYSRMMYIEFTTQMDEGTLLRCHINAFQYFDGVPSKILYDNQKTVVTSRDSEGYPIWNERFATFAKHYCFTPKLCRPYRPRTKGKVERLVRYIRENFFCGIEFSNLADINHQAMTWLNSVANCRTHQTTQIVPFERWKEENLLAVSIYIFDTATYTQRRVAMDGMISYRRNYYSAPWQFVGRDILIRLDGTKLEALFDGKVIAKHELVNGQFHRIINKEHYHGIQKKQQQNRLEAMQIPVAASSNVQIRSLSAYEDLVS